MRRARLSVVALAALAAFAAVACGEVLHVTPAKIPQPEPVASAPAPAPEAPKKRTVKLADSLKLDGDQIRIKGHVEFDTDRSTLRMNDAETAEALRDMLQALKENPQITKLKVEGHTDNRGTAEKNKKLSMDRAEAVVAYFVKNGIDASRLQPAGFGPDRPKDTNDTVEGRRENRRVEFHISEMDGKPFTP